jgi:hypothetical protein
MKQERVRMIQAVVCLALVGSGCTGGIGDSPFDDEPVNKAGLTFEEFMAMAYRDPATGEFLVDGDTPIETVGELADFYVHNVREGALTVYSDSGQIGR